LLLVKFAVFGLGRTFLHPLHPGCIYVDEVYRILWAYLGTGGITAAKIAFDYLAAIEIVINGAEWAGDGANLAADAALFGNDLGASCFIDADCLHRAYAHTPGFLALGAGERDVSVWVFDREYLDA
jgi:hypothetical protein